MRVQDAAKQVLWRLGVESGTVSAEPRLPSPPPAASVPALEFLQAWHGRLTCQPAVWAGAQSGP